MPFPTVVEWFDNSMYRSICYLMINIKMGSFFMKVRKAVIPAAGFGTRFLPATKAMPKEMIPIVDKPTIQYIVEEVVESGIEEILIITGKSKRSIEDHFDHSVELELELEKKEKTELLALVQNISGMVDVHYIRQKESKGLGHAIGCAKTFVGNEPFAVLLGDDVVYTESIPCLRQLIDCYDMHKSSVLGVQTVADADVNKYGIIDGNQLDERIYAVNNLTEKPSIETAPSNVAILGRYIINPDIFDIIEKTEPGKDGEIQLTDALMELATKEGMVAYEFDGIRYDVGNKQGFLEATVETALRRDDLKAPFLDYLKKVVKDQTVNQPLR